MKLKLFDIFLISILLFLISLTLFQHFKFEKIELPVSKKSFGQTPLLVASLSYFLIVFLFLSIITGTLLIVNYFEKKGEKGEI